MLCYLCKSGTAGHFSSETPDHSLVINSKAFLPPLNLSASTDCGSLNDWSFNDFQRRDFKQKGFKLIKLPHAIATF